MPEIKVKSILNKTKRRDPWFLDDYTLNMYSGCSFNCLYCYIRGSKYGEHMERNLGIKINGLELLEKQLSNRAKKGQYGIIVLSSATDPYLQLEENHQLTRGALKIILKYKFPVHIITKSDLIQRDFDLLHEIDQAAVLPEDLQPKLKRGTIITFSFSTISDEISKIFEPGATPPSKRLQVFEKVKKAGFLAGISMMPMIPFISDTGEHLEEMFSTFKKINADYVFPATITLFGNGNTDSKTLILRAVEKHYPHLKEKYISWFSNSNQMPEFYRNAFHKKMQELHAKYDLKNRIIQQL